MADVVQQYVDASAPLANQVIGKVKRRHLNPHQRRSVRFRSVT